MAIELKVPQSGESITEVQIGQWRKSEGDHVEVDEVLVEIETDKAAVELPAPVSGVLKKILIAEGQDASVGDVVGLLEEGEAAADGDKKDKKAEKKQEPEKEEPKKEAAEADSGDKAAKEAPEPEPEEEQKPAAAPAVMPAAQRILEQEGIDPSDVEGSGKGGRVLKEDAQRAAEAKKSKIEEPKPKKPRSEPEQEEESGPPEPSTEPGREEEVVAMTMMRRSIARNLLAAQQNAALLTTFNECDMTAVMDARKRFKDAFFDKHGVKLGFMSFFVKAAVEALRLVPAVNARIEGKHIVYCKYHDIGIAVGGGRGLVVPILRNAENMTFADIERKIVDFAQRAKDNKIQLSELQGGTFTISNGGIYGSMLSTPIVNAPQSGILGLHNIQQRPVVAESGEIVARPMMYLALTYDHRLVDGREAVTFLKRIKDVIENPERMLLEV